MTPGLYVLLAAEMIGAFFIVYLIQIPFRKIRNRFLLLFLFLLKAALMIYLGLSLIAFDYKIIWNNEYPFAALYHVLVPDVFTDILFFILSFFRKDRADHKARFITAAVLAAVFAIYSVFNMQTISARFHEISSPKLKHEYRLAFFADLHYGTPQSQKTVDRALDEIRDLHPDCLLLGGDITDENTEKEEMEYLYERIASLNIPVYFIYGNHDRQERAIARFGARKYSEADLEKALLANGIRILYEDHVEINDDLLLLGREDPSHPDQRKAVRDLPPFSKDRYVVTVDHTPYQIEDIMELDADLQLSGHTHAAQFFPIRTVYRILGLNVYGDYQIGDTHLYVSPGIAGWGLPLRSEAHCNYEVFDLKPE